MSRRWNDSGACLRLAHILWGWRPHPTQRRWLVCDADVKVAACGRRWGKTEAAAVDASTMALLEPGSVQIIVSPTYDQSRLIFDTVERLMLSSPITRPLTKITRTPYPRLSILGSIIMARTADEDGRNLRGHAADRVIVDEAAFVRDTVINEVISPMLADRNGQLVMISTPFGKNHFYRAFIRGQNRSAQNGRRSTASFSFPSWENPHISRDYIEEQRSVLSPRQFAVEYEAQFLDDRNAVFTWDDIETAARFGEGCRGLDDSQEEYEVVTAGIDWARYSDYTAIVAVGVKDSHCAVVGIERFNEIGWDLQIERVARFLESHRVAAALCDSTSVGDPLLDQLKARLWENGADTVVEGLVFTNQSKRDLIEHLALRFAQGIITIPRDEQLIRELQYFEYELTASGNIRMNASAGHHDDLVTALALACWRARTSGIPAACLAGRRRIAAADWGM